MTGRSTSGQTASLPGDFEVVELRRYRIEPEQREHFARYFDTYFPEAFQQLGAMALGQFSERDDPALFTWLRGFRDVEARAIVNAAFYYGPVWTEHKERMNGLMLDSDNVLLLRPLHAEYAVGVLPAVDPVAEEHVARGIVVAQIFPVAPHGREAFAEHAEAAFERYRIDGIRAAGILVTLDAANNFPQLPVRSDGPFLVWLGLVEDERTLRDALRPAAQHVAQSLSGTGWLRGAVELIVMDPTSRSRLRWS